jgi:sugar phosphate permease
VDADRTARPLFAKVQEQAQVTTLILLFLAGMINFLDRSFISIANGFIRRELHLSATQMGGLLSAFSLAYGLTQLPVGPLFDRAGSKRILGTGLTIWSVATVLTGLVTRLSSFLALRVTLGLGRAPFSPYLSRSFASSSPSR